MAGKNKGFLGEVMPPKWFKDFWEFNEKNFPTTLTIKGRAAFFVIRHWGFFKFFFKFVRLGKFKSPDGTEYWGIKVSGPW